jgi:hypothetical protein
MNKNNNYSFLIAINQNVINKVLKLKIKCENENKSLYTFHK